MRRLSLLVVGSTLVLFPLLSHAARFPDVPDGHLYKAEVEFLVREGVVHGNPDGNFYPEKSVNRAEILKMLYLASKRTPDPAAVDCFPDVEGWYESYVCDAVANRFVQGYTDGTFKPGKAVNRVEALKMIAEVFGLPIPELTDEMREVVKFVDVSLSAWYTKYLYAAFARSVLPIVGQRGPRFYPDWPLLRGEAAAYIFNALYQRDAFGQAEETPTEEVTRPSRRDDEVRPPPPPPAPMERAMIFDVTFPFDHTETFEGRKPSIYHFTLAEVATADIKVAIAAGQAGGVSCRLYKLSDQGFSLEYYLGFEEGGSCYLLTALGAGSYQLEVRPEVAGTGYSVKASSGQGDGNDGFRQAASLQRGSPRTDALMPSDYADWFKVVLAAEERHTLTLSSSAVLPCLIHPMEDVDLYGFVGPQCNEEYSYPSGTYYIGVYHGTPRGARQTYTIQWK